MNKAQEVTAIFKKVFSLTVNKSGDGTGSIEGIGINCGSDCKEEKEKYVEGTYVTLTATAGHDSIFEGWSGACSGTGNCYVTMNQAQKVTANFKIKEFPLNVSKNGTGKGKITGSGINCGSHCEMLYEFGTPVTLTATADADSLFINWSGACSGNNSCNMTMNQVQEVTATFNIKMFQLTVNKHGTGAGRVEGNSINCGSDCSENYNINTSVTLTAIPNAGSSFINWSGACSGNTGNCTVAMAQSKNVIATFQPIIDDEQLLTINKIGSGDGIVTSSPSGINCGSNCQQKYDKNSSVTLTAEADAGSIFTGWGNSCSGNAVTCIINMSSDKTVTTKFDLCEYTVTPLKSSYGVDGGDSTIEVTAPVGCEWEAVNHNKGWLNITASNNGVVEYTVSANESSTERTGTFTIAGQTVTIEQGIDVNEPPVALFTVSSLEGTAPLVVTVDASDSSDPDDDSITYQWETSDGHTATGITTDFTFEEVNSCEKTITLTVTDDGGLFDQETETVSSEDCAIVEFLGLKETYAVGERMTVKLLIDVNVSGHKRVDLWVAIQIPIDEWIEGVPPLLLFSQGYGINQFVDYEVKFNADYSFEREEEEYTLVDFTIPKGVGGTFVFYALYVDEDKNPMEHLQNLSEIMRSELVIKQTILAYE